MFQCSAASPIESFQLTKLFNKLKAVCPDVQKIVAYNHYFCQLEQKLSESEQEKCLSLLNATTAIQEPIETCHKVIVVPRIGTISPWSSKATDICHNCDLTSIKRVEHGVRYYLLCEQADHPASEVLDIIQGILFDPLTQSVLFDEADAQVLFAEDEPAPVKHIDIINGGMTALEIANKEQGFALNSEEMEYLLGSYQSLDRNPSDVELMMFAQINSEHCRHKIFNADWQIDNQTMPESLFAMIKTTYQANQEGVISAYCDNAAIIEGSFGARFFSDPHGRAYTYTHEPIHIVFKVETHNHPTAISPFPGAATGNGGEIRDEGATGRGATPKAGLCGFSVSHLHIPDYPQPWEEASLAQPRHLASAFDIMIDGPLGAASFNNEFGRPNICGYFRNFEILVDEGRGQLTRRGYHKPIMIAGGIGNVRESHCHKKTLPNGVALIVLGGPAMRIGLGGGAASSMTSGSSSQALDFASVQRGNPEMERRAQEVINACWALGDENPIISIHDVGAGGLSNALPEIVHDSARGAEVELRMVLNDEPGMSPLEIWCNEAQERYVLAIEQENIDQFTQIATRERCPFAVVGQVTHDTNLIVGDGHFNNYPINLPMSLLFGKPPKMLRSGQHHSFDKKEFATSNLELRECISRVLRFPTVASKEFLITIGDRTVTGLIARDQMVGPWQIPVADCAVTASTYQGFTGEAMAMGERAPVAVLHPAASGRLAVAEAITNIAAATIGKLSDIKLSANWMAAASQPGDDVALFDTVRTVAKDMCQKLGLVIPVGKDSLSMRAVWQEGEQQHEVVSPLSLVISAASPVTDIRLTLTPQCRLEKASVLLLIDLGKGQQRMGGSVLAQTYQQLGHHTPDCDDVHALETFFNFIQHNRAQIMAYHDRSDGGLLTTLFEMAFAGHCGLDIDTSVLGDDPIKSLFNEELGAVIQVAKDDLKAVLAKLHDNGLGHHTHLVATLRQDDAIVISHQQQKLYQSTREQCQRLWQETSYRMQAARDNPACAEQAFQQAGKTDDPGLHAHTTFDLQSLNELPHISTKVRPRMAILREQGVNGHMEMAAAFDHAGFESVDVHMQDILTGYVSLNDFSGLVACGGFSFGDVLGAGRGWANSILYHTRARDAFEQFFQRRDTITLGVCNGCQMLSQLTDIIPGSAHWPTFVGNESGQYEARLSMVEILDTPSVLFEGMVGSRLPIAIAHGEGRAQFADEGNVAILRQNRQICLRYVDNWGNATEQYPGNPNGSPQGATGMCSLDGRVTIIMPHPERVYRREQCSWHPDDWPEVSPWFKMFVNARRWLEN